MDLLNNDCLQHIFSNFSIKQRFKLEQVSHRWKALMPYQDYHYINETFDVLTIVKWKPYQTVQVKHGPCSKCDKDTIKFISQQALLDVFNFYLHRLGKVLKSISFNSDCNLGCLITPEVLQSISALDQNVTKLAFNRCLIMNSAFNVLIDNYRLISLIMNYCTIIDSDQFQIIDGCSLIKELISKSLPTLTILELRGIKKARLHFPKNSLVKGNLSKVILVDCYVTSVDLECLLDQNRESIQYLEIGSCLSILRFESIANLSNLSELILRQSMITVIDFALICNHCKNIAKLQLEKCPRLVDLSSVKELKLSLKHFSIIGKSMHIGDHVLAQLANGGLIETLEIIDCIMSDNAFRNMMHFAKHLISVKMKGTNVTRGTLSELQNLVPGLNIERV